MPSLNTPRRKPVNVASVPHRSPFRYPGGKTWLIPEIRRWLSDETDGDTVLVEPFAGGGVVTLSAVAEGLVDHGIMVEMDEDVAAVWRVIIDGDAEGLAQRIQDFGLIPRNVDRLLALDEPSLFDRAFRTIVRNRISHGGIIAPGSGRMKTGENGKGIASRWYPGTLAKRIRKIMTFRDRLTFIQGDGIEVLRQHSSNPAALAFVDPPYTAAGKRAGARLYVHHEMDHDELFDVMRSFQGRFLMTYDNEEEIASLAKARGFDTRPIAMKSTHHAKMTELLISREFDWASR